MNWAIQDTNIKSLPPGNKELMEKGKNVRVQNPVHIGQVCSELQQVIDAWPKLSKQRQTQIFALSKLNPQKQ